MSDKNHCVNYRDLHVSLPLYPGCFRWRTVLPTYVPAIPQDQMAPQQGVGTGLTMTQSWLENGAMLSPRFAYVVLSLPLLLAACSDGGQSKSGSVKDAGGIDGTGNATSTRTGTETDGGSDTRTSTGTSTTGTSTVTSTTGTGTGTSTTGTSTGTSTTGTGTGTSTTGTSTVTSTTTGTATGTSTTGTGTGTSTTGTSTMTSTAGTGTDTVTRTNTGTATETGSVGGDKASCIGLAATCGPSANEDCCTSLPVPGGTFNRSNDARYPATVSDFVLDKYELTVGRFRAFVNANLGTQANPPPAGTGVHPLIASSGWDASWNQYLPSSTAALKSSFKCDPPFQTWTEAPGANENRPMNCISWYLAFAICAWDGGWLPTEAEWNYAAAGGAEQREYPWGSGIDPSEASYNDPVYGCTGDADPACTLADLIVVGSKPAGNGRWGHADLAGNVMEWALDWYATYSPTCVDCADLVTATCRVVRGGYFYYIPGNSRTSVRFDGFIPEVRASGVGVRCARSTP